MRSEAEIRAKLEQLRKQYEESMNNPIESIQDRTNEKYVANFESRSKQLKDELDWIGEIAILEWVIGEYQGWLPSWMREARA